MMTGPAPKETADAVCTHYGNDPALLIEILHDVQDALGHVPEACLSEIAKALNIARAEVHGVMSFYHDFRSAPVDGVVVKLCQAEACQAMGAKGLAAALEGQSGLTIQPAYCLGNCALAPAAMLDGQLIGRATPDKLAALAAEAEA